MSLPKALVEEDQRLRALAVEQRDRRRSEGPWLNGFAWEDWDYASDFVCDPEWTLAELRNRYTLNDAGEVEVQGVDGEWSFKEYADAVGVSKKEVKQAAKAFSRWLSPKTFKCGCQCYCRSVYRKTVERALIGEASY